MADACALHRAFGPVVRLERQRLGLTCAELGRRIGMAKNNLSRLERGEPSDPLLSTLSRFARGLGMEASELLALVEAYAAAPGAAQGGDAEDHRPSASEMREPAAADVERARRLLGDTLFPHQTAGTETGDSLSPGINRVEDTPA